MRNFKRSLEQDIKLEKQLLAQYQRELAALPPGSLSSCTKNGKHYYTYCLYKPDKVTGKSVMLRKYLCTQDVKLLHLLKRKAFIKKSISRLRRNLALQEKLYAVYQPYDTATILDELAQSYKYVPSDHTQNQKICALQAQAIAQAVYPDKLLQPTLAGFNVRSKSEALIVNAMASRHINFVYEQPVILLDENGDPCTLRPDFTIHLVSSDLILWEHFGLLSNDRYLEAQMHKLKVYQRNNYVVGQNLILTADDSQGKLDLAAVSRYLDMLCDMGAAGPMPAAADPMPGAAGPTPAAGSLTGSALNAGINIL